MLTLVQYSMPGGNCTNVQKHPQTGKYQDCWRDCNLVSDCQKEFGPDKHFQILYSQDAFILHLPTGSVDVLVLKKMSVVESPVTHFLSSQVASRQRNGDLSHLLARFCHFDVSFGFECIRSISWYLSCQRITAGCVCWHQHTHSSDGIIQSWR